MTQDPTCDNPVDETTALPRQTFELKRLGVVMEPEPGNTMEVEGVLNSASARGRDGQLYLFPRLVARGNYSRIGIARVRFNEAGDPVGVERLGIALEPEADYELRPDGGGCEDPRITVVEPLQRYDGRRRDRTRLPMRAEGGGDDQRSEQRFHHPAPAKSCDCRD